MDNEIVYEDNLITTAGKALALNVLAGKRIGFVNSIVVGIGSQAATTADKALEFEAGTADITTVLVDTVNEKIYYKASLSDRDNYLINELGCLANNALSANVASGRQAGILYNFNELATWIDDAGTHTLSPTNSKIDTSSIQYSFNNTTVTGHANMPIDLSLLPADTKFSFAYHSTDVDDLILNLKTDDSNYYTVDSWSISNGYHIATANKSDFVATGSPNWNNITSIEVSAVANTAAVISLDAIRYDSNPTEESSLLSRAVLSTPKQKLAGVTMDVEYVLDLDI